MSLYATTSQTVGPYLHIGLTWLIRENLVGPGVTGEPVTIASAAAGAGNVKKKVAPCSTAASAQMRPP